MGEELTTKAGGAAIPDPTVTPAGGEVGQGAAAGADAATAEPQQKVEKPPNLDDMPSFRNWKRTMDQRVEAEHKARVEAERRLEELQRQAEEAQLAGAEPEEQAAYYRNLAARTREQMTIRQAQDEERQQIIGHVYEELGRLGLDPSTEGLEWPDEITWPGAAQVLASAARLVQLQAQTAQKEQEGATSEAARQARLQALEETGVAHVSAQTGAPASTLREEFERRKKELLGSGRVADYAELKREMAAKGLEV